MNDILEKLWGGNIRPFDRSIRYGSEYRELQKSSGSDFDKFYEGLSQEAKDAYESFCEKQGKMSVISDMDFFIKGFRLGVQLIISAIGPYDSQLPQIEDD